MTATVGSSVPETVYEPQITGCSSCPAAQHQPEGAIFVCGLSEKPLEITCDADGELIDAVPASCPLWAGPITLRLARLAK